MRKDKEKLIRLIAMASRADPTKEAKGRIETADLLAAAEDAHGGPSIGANLARLVADSVNMAFDIDTGTAPAEEKARKVRVRNELQATAAILDRIVRALNKQIAKK